MSKSQKGGSSPIFGVKINYKSNSKQHFYITISLGVLIQNYEIFQLFFVTLISNPYWQIRKNNSNLLLQTFELSFIKHPHAKLKDNPSFPSLL